MRVWHYKLLPFLPDAQFKGQLRELVAVMRGWRDDGVTNHLLINRVLEYDKAELHRYFDEYETEYYRRYNKCLIDYQIEFAHFSKGTFANFGKPIFNGWHNKEYLRICMSNLLEKHRGIGKSRITDEEWARLCEGYEQITGEPYAV